MRYIASRIRTIERNVIIYENRTRRPLQGAFLMTLILAI